MVRLVSLVLVSLVLVSLTRPIYLIHRSLLALQNWLSCENWLGCVNSCVSTGCNIWRRCSFFLELDALRRTEFLELMPTVQIAVIRLAGRLARYSSSLGRRRPRREPGPPLLIYGLAPETAGCVRPTPDKSAAIHVRQREKRQQPREAAQSAFSAAEP